MTQLSLVPFDIVCQQVELQQASQSSTVKIYDRGTRKARSVTVWNIIHSVTARAAKRICGPQGKRKLGSSPSILQIMILKLSPPRCVISKESVQQKWIDELWFRKQLSTCLFFWTLNYNDLVHLLNSWPPGHRLDFPPPLSVGLVTANRMSAGSNIIQYNRDYPR